MRIAECERRISESRIDCALIRAHDLRMKETLEKRTKLSALETELFLEGKLADTEGREELRQEASQLLAIFVASGRATKATR